MMMQTDNCQKQDWGFMLSNVLSLGAGVQSSVMALMAAKGELSPMPDCAIFSDTQWEPQGIYDHLEWITPQLPFPVYIVTAGDIRKDLIAGKNSTGQDFTSVPVFVPGNGMGRRQCTMEYKIRPIRKKIRELLGVKRGERVKKGTLVNVWMGISTDEMIRMKDSQDLWINHQFPLIDNNMSRDDCMVWWGKHYGDRKLAKSACIGCPYKRNDQWLDMKKNDSVSWEDAVEVDNAIRNVRGKEQFLHRSCKPLNEVELEIQEKNTLSGFLEECDGMCGV